MRKTILSALLMCLGWGAFAHDSRPAEANTDLVQQETISITGDATIEQEPDTVMFTVGVQTIEEKVSSAVSQNNRRTQAVIDALLASGAKRENVQTMNFSVYPQMDYGNERGQNRQPRILGYQVSNEVSVRSSDPAAASKLLQAAIDAGANSGGGLRFIVSDSSASKESGLRAAIADARRKASILAEASGRKLGRALSITEGGASPPPTPWMKTANAPVAVAPPPPPVPVSAGTERLHFIVSVVFALD